MCWRVRADVRVEIFVPGRLCLFGEHSDWAGALRAHDSSVAPGACLIAGTNQGIRARVTPCDIFEITTRLPDGSTRGPLRVPMDVAALEQVARSADFFSYSAGVAAVVANQTGVPGVRIDIVHDDLPIARGLSSSAAICVLTARAFGCVHGLGLSLREEMDFAYRGELLAGSQCGRMDQACAYGSRPVLLRFDGEQPMQVEPLVAGGVLHLLIVDLQSAKNTRRILADLHACFRDRADPRCAPLRAALGALNLTTVERAAAALAAGDARVLGELMSEAQAVFDRDVAPACPHELRAPKLHAVLEHPAAARFAWGGKGVGSQGDGTAQFVCRGAAERDELAAILEADAGVRCLPLTVGETSHARGSAGG